MYDMRTTRGLRPSSAASIKLLGEIVDDYGASYEVVKDIGFILKRDDEHAS